MGGMGGVGSGGGRVKKEVRRVGWGGGEVCGVERWDERESGWSGVEK